MTGVVITPVDFLPNDQSEKASGAGEEPHSFLLALGDALRPLTTVEEIVEIAIRMLGEQLELDRVVYVEIDATGNRRHVRWEWARGEMKTRIGNSQLDVFGPPLVQAQAAGETCNITDIRTNPLTREGIPIWDRLEVRALIAVPLVKNRRWISSLAGLSSAPREWKDGEVALVGEVAERTWEAVERGRAEEALQKSEKRLQLALEAAQMGTFFWHVDEDCVEPDARMLDLLGVPADAVFSSRESFASLIHPGDSAKFAEVLERTLDPAGAGALDVELRILHPDGLEHWITIIGQVVFEGEPRRARHVSGIVVDVTGRKRVEEELRASRAKLAREAETMRDLYDSSMRLFSAPDVQTALEETLDSTMRLIGADFGAVQLYDPERKTLELAVLRGFDEQSEDQCDLLGIEEGTACARTIQTRQRVLIEDVEQDAEFEEYRHLAAKAGFRAIQTTPLLNRDGQLLGIVSTHFRKPHRPTQSELFTVELYARTAADFILRARAEAALRESHTRIVQILENTSDCFYSVDPDFRFTYVNPRTESYFGMSKEEMIGRVYTDVLPRDEGHEVLLRQQQAFKNKRADQFEFLSPMTGKWIELHAVPTDCCLNVFFRDITKRRRVEEALRKSEQRYRSLFESIDEGFCVVEVLFDENDKPTDYRFLEVNPAFERHTGIRDATDRTMREIAPNHEEQWFQVYGRVARTGEPKRFEQRADALDRHFDVYAFRTGEPTEHRVAILFNDITERKKTEEALRTSEERFRFLVESAREYAIFTTDLDMRVTSWNSGAERILGFSEQEISGRIADVVFTEEDRSAGQPEKEKRQALSTGCANDERWHLRKDGSRFWANGFLMPMRDSAGHAFGLVKILRNDTDRMKAREQLEAGNEQLQKALEESKQARKEAERANRAKDRFLTVMSHELRTPLTPVIMATQLLLRRSDLDEETIEMIRMIHRNVQLESRFIDDLLDFARIKSGKMEILKHRVDLRSVLLNAVEVVRPEIDAKHQQLETFLDAAEHTLVGDATRLQQVFWNLLKNASKFTPVDGRISIRTWSEEGNLAVEIHDTGIGFKEGAVDQIFEAFIQLNRSAAQNSGLGLGLAIARGAVEAHGGSILAKSEGPGTGSSFVVRLPLSRDET